MIKRILTTASALSMTAGMAAADFSLNVIHINDLHSRIEPINRFDSTCNAEDNAEGKCFGGYARVKTMIDQLRAELAERDAELATLRNVKVEPERIEVPVVPQGVKDTLAELAARAEALAAEVDEKTAD